MRYLDMVKMWGVVWRMCTFVYVQSPNHNYSPHSKQTHWKVWITNTTWVIYLYGQAQVYMGKWLSMKRLLYFDMYDFFI